MKFLCLCQGGNSRSVACAYVLKYSYGHDALSCSWQKNSDDTLEMLFNWADVIIVMETHYKNYVPEAFHSKLHIVNVGPDIWMNGLHPDLCFIIDDKLQPVFAELTAAF